MVSTPFIAITILLLNLSSSLYAINTTLGHNSFAPGLATWYGDETGAGSGGACGWENDVMDSPFSSMISAGNAKIFLNGKGCGNCFQILCTRQPFCSRKPIRVTVSDECPGHCNDVPIHFDLSGFAFGAMGNPGQDHNLRQLGQVDIFYRRIPCNYGRKKIAFKVSKDSNPNWFAVALEYANGDGGFQSVEIAAGGTNNFVAMDNIWGATWKKDIDPSFMPPFSFRLTSVDYKTVVAQNVIPPNFTNGQKYLSKVNF